MAQVTVGGLKMEWNWIMEPGADGSPCKFSAKVVPLRRVYHEKVPYMLSPRRLERKREGGLGQFALISFG